MSAAEEQTDTLIVYGRPNCPMVPPVLGLLETAEVPFSYVDINQDWDARERVRAINGGNESVPTLVFRDGTTLTEPGVGALRDKLREQGYETAAIDSWTTYVRSALRNPINLILLALVVWLAITIFR